MIVDDKRELMTNTKKICIYNWVANETNKQTTAKKKREEKKRKEK